MSCHCPSLTALVQGGICARCDHHGVCPNEAMILRQMSEDVNSIPVMKALEIYNEKANVCHRRKLSMSASIKSALRISGLGDSAKLTDFTPSVIDSIVDAMRKPGAKNDGSVFSESSIASCLENIRTLDGKKMRKHYMAAGYDMTMPLDIDTSKYAFKRPNVQKVSIKSIQMLIERMTVLKHSGRKTDRNVFLYMFLALYVGMSRVDICNARWGMFRDGYDGKHAIYERHKTGREAGGKLTPQEWFMIADLADADDNYIINLSTRGGAKSGERACFSVMIAANKVCAECGIGIAKFAKKCHALRKFKAQMIRAFGGVKEAARMLGDTVRITDRNYAGETSYSSIMGVA